MQLSVVIVSYNVRHFLQQCLASVYASGRELEMEVLVVDNASVDGSVAMVAALYPQATLIASHVNLGFSRGNNLALRQAKGKYQLLLNPDTVLQEDTLSTCLAFMEAHPDAGGLGVKMIDGKGTFLPESKRGLPTPAVAAYKIFGLAGLFPKSRRFGRYHLGFIGEDETAEIDVLSGAFMLMRKAALDKAGLLDEDFFMYGEDIDLSYRLQKAGYKNYYLPTTRIIHYKGESTKRASVNYVRTFYGAMAIFAEKHFSQGYGQAMRVLIMLAIWGRAILSVVGRVVKALYLPLFDATLIWLGMYGLKQYWEAVTKFPGYYNEAFMQMVVPVWALLWVLSAWFNGAYKRPFTLGSILASVGIGTLAISAASNFADAYRFSKALILLGSGYALVSMIGLRLLDNYRLYRTLSLGGQGRRKALILGSAEEAGRAISILARAEAPVTIQGWVSPFDVEPAAATADPLYAGQATHLPELVRIFQADEIIFCARDVPSHKMMEWMAQLGPAGVEFKISPTEAEFILGSSSSKTAGELYALELRVGLPARLAARKRFADVIIATLLLLTAPLSIWAVRQKGQFLANVWDVLRGKLTWISMATLPQPQQGVLSTAGQPMLEAQSHDAGTLRRADALYVRSYSLTQDLVLVLRGFKELGSRQPQTQSLT